MPSATLLAIQGADQGARFEVGEQIVTIGRGLQNTVRILDTEVSRSHAELSYRNGECVLQDCNSSNGTFVNGVQIHTHTLSPGDQIQIGRTVLLFADAGTEVLPEDASAQVDLLSKHDPSDRSSIVSSLYDEVVRSGEAAPRPDASAAPTVDNLRLLYRISEEAVRPSVPADQLLARILEFTIDAVGAERGCILVSDPDTGAVAPHVFRVRNDQETSARMAVSMTIVDYVLKNKQGVRTTDARVDSRFDTGQSILSAGIRDAICVPMQGRSELLGVIYLDIISPPNAADRAASAHHFRDEDVRLLMAVGRQAALALENSRYQQAFVKAERLAAMGQTIATLSHHIKNILQGVRGGSYLIDVGLKDHDEDLVRRGWGIVDKNQNRIYNLVMDMLSFSKDRQPTLEPADLNEVVGDVVELMESRAAECEVRLLCELGDDVPSGVFDAEAIHRAALNIITNAIDAVEGRPQATVQVITGYDRAADALIVAVTDNGPGIEEEMCGKIFQVFESTKGSRGTGLGLAVSRKIIREHGGDITVESRLGDGSRFTLSWPRADEDPHSENDKTLV